MDVDGELDRLYSVPLEDFIKERDEIAAAVKKAGDGEAAARIKKLAKPSVAAWAMNQIARRHADEIDQLLAVQDELARADSPAELRSLSGRRRELVAKLTSLAKEVLVEGGHGTSASTVEKISQGLLASGSEDEGEDLRRGRLTREPSGSGLEAFGLMPEEDPSEASASPVPLKTQREVQKLRREAERLQQEAARLAQEADFAEAQAQRARAKAEEAADAADAAMAKAHDAAESAGI